MPKSSCLIGLLWSGQSFGESTLSDFESPLNFQVKEEKNYLIQSRNNEIMLQLKMLKWSCLKWTYGRPGIDYRVASLFTRYLTAIGIIPESLNSLGQF